MVNDDVKKAVRDQLGNARDNLHRASSSWRGLDADDMGRQYGESGQTRSQILKGYEDEVARWQAALDSLG